MIESHIKYTKKAILIKHVHTTAREVVDAFSYRLQMVLRLGMDYI